ncbi:MAG: GyrI-like domain-containing protein [Deltaproteobacteria bacterium]|nr:GyrI-like domain-containing protein [Deltaproteobacteria bacterium]
MAQKIDFKKELRELYTAGKKIQRVEAGCGVFLCASGKGEPGSQAFQDAIGQLYGVAYTAKFASKLGGGIDFAVPPLECLWHDDPAKIPVTQWRWELLIRVPEAIGAPQIKSAKAELLRRRGTDASGVARKIWKEGTALQTMHVGPYDGVGATYAQLAAHAAEQGLVPKGPGHEIYLSDPRRVAPEKLRTIVRLPCSARR